MRVLKKINNNVAICVDKNDQQLIAMGKGIGFPKTPYELTDLSKIEMTFYRVSEQTKNMLESIPENVIEVSYEILRYAQKKLLNNLYPNVLLSLSDHIGFAIQRANKGLNFDYSLSYDIKHLYPAEYEVGLFALKLVKEEFQVQLPDSEAVAIAMHFINAREFPLKTYSDDLSANLLETVLRKVEDHFKISLDRNGFSVSRFKIHFKYYLDRLKENKQISNEISQKLFKDFIAEHTNIARCAEDIVSTIDEQLHTHTTDNEMFYLMIYINRMINKVRGTKDE